MTAPTHKDIHAALLKVTTNPEDPAICDQIQSIDTRYLLTGFVMWEHFSGDLYFPVPGASFHLAAMTAERTYNTCSSYWTGQYGTMRRKLLTHLIDYYSSPPLWQVSVKYHSYAPHDSVPGTRVSILPWEGFTSSDIREALVAEINYAVTESPQPLRLDWYQMAMNAVIFEQNWPDLSALEKVEGHRAVFTVETIPLGD